MKHQFEQPEIDLALIERDARRLRAQATRDAAVALGTWVRSHLSFGGKRTA